MYLNLNEKNLKKYQEEGKKEAIEQFGDDDAKDDLLFGEADHTIDTWEIRDNEIHIDVTAKHKGEVLVFFSLDIPLDMDDIAELISRYIKKANKIKTLLEASK